MKEERGWTPQNEWDSEGRVVMIVYYWTIISQTNPSYTNYRGNSHKVEIKQKRKKRMIPIKLIVKIGNFKTLRNKKFICGRGTPFF